MPITDFQRNVLQLLRANRNPNSYVAGAIAIHRAQTSARQSNDIDFFHDTDEAVRTGAEADLKLLDEKRYGIKLLIDQPSFVRAVIDRGGQSLKLEWVRDSAFRFFPVVPDEELGYRLHDVDLAVNKCLTLANRTEVRDIIDIVQMDREVLSLPAMCWASCGKDPGFTPELLLDCMKRHAIIRPEQLGAEALAVPLTAPQLKKQWLSLVDPAPGVLAKFPASDLGCIYLDSRGEVVRTPIPEQLAGYQQHFGSVSGSWPRLVA